MVNYSSIKHLNTGFYPIRLSQAIITLSEYMKNNIFSVSSANLFHKKIKQFMV